MKVIPVIDLLNGAVVHAVRGKRSEYHPLKSVLCESADPLAVAQAFKRCGFTELYVADLDAIMGKGENLAVLRRITEETGLALMVDAGVSDVEKAERLFQNKVSKAVIGTETLSSLDFLKSALARFGSEKIVVSLDLKEGKVLSASKQIAAMEPVQLARKLQSMGVGELIVLDLARVGSGEGVDVALLGELLKALKIRVDVGGGVRDLNELTALKAMGINGVLLATALHSGKISVDVLRRLGFMQT